MSGRLTDEAAGDARRAGPWRYIRSCGLLLIPVIVWNVAFTPYLPHVFDAEIFWKDIPAPLAFAENALRVVVFALPFLMPLELADRHQRLGLALVAAGLLVYFGAWLPLMFAPQSIWSTSLLGFTAPAVTPLIWLSGIGVIGRRLYWRLPYRRWHYLAISTAFVAAHFAHTALIFCRAGRA